MKKKLTFLSCFFLLFFLDVTYAQNVGIGVPNPLHKLDVAGEIHSRIIVSSVYGYAMNGLLLLDQDLYGNLTIGRDNPGLSGWSSSEFNTLVGSGAGIYSNNISGNTLVGHMSNANNSFVNNSCAFGDNTLSQSWGCAFGVNSVSGIRGVAIGAAASAYHENSIAIGYQASTSAINTIRPGNNSITGIFAKVGLTITSDKNAKENFKLLNAEEILTKLSKLSISTWNLKGHNAQQNRHYGPMAQDFYAAFGKDNFGTIGSDTTINTHDLSSINTLAIQALEKRTRQIEKLQNENEMLKKEMQHLKLSIIKENDQLKQLLVTLVKEMESLAEASDNNQGNETVSQVTVR